jgi:beta-lactamase class A
MRGTDAGRRRAGWRVLAWTALAAAGCGTTPQREVGRLLARVKGRVAVAVSDAKQETSWSIRGDEPFAAGDSIGLYVMAELFRQVEAGKVSLDERLPLDGRDRPEALARLSSVGEVSLRDLAVLMLSEADRVATNMLIDRLGLEGINRTAQLMGAKRTTVERRLGYAAPPENYTTANDLAAVWRAITDANNYSEAVRARLDEVLRASRSPARLVAEVPAADVRTHYDGDSAGRAALVHGSGLLYLPDRHVAVAVLGERLESKFVGREMVRQVLQTVQARCEEKSRHADN